MIVVLFLPRSATNPRYRIILRQSYREIGSSRCYGAEKMVLHLWKPAVEVVALKRQSFKQLKLSSRDTVPFNLSCSFSKNISNVFLQPCTKNNLKISRFFEGL
jgi:hypothetical protein